MAFPSNILDYRNESVIERVMKEQNVDRATAEAWFVEMLKFLQLCADAEQMLSPNDEVDHAWHAFILHMRDYAEFCEHYFGKQILHQPTGDPDPEAFERTQVAYVQRYGAQPTYAGVDPIWPIIWFAALDSPGETERDESSSAAVPGAFAGSDTSDHSDTSSSAGSGSDGGSASSCSSSSCSSASSCSSSSCGGGGSSCGGGGCGSGG